MSAALLLLNGPLTDPALVKRRAAAAGLVVCADGGARHAVKLGIQPRVVVGDFDSLPKPLPRWKGTTYLFDDDPELSDFEKSLRFLKGAGASQVWIAGLWGGRPDHQLVNLAVFESWSKKLHLGVVDPGWANVAGPGKHRIPCPAGANISIVPAGTTAVVSTKNLKYPLKKARLTRSSRGLSNVALRSPIEVTVHSGRVWVVLP
ncbi:MAG: thiamine diphosphokinase [Elusimicrobia bacterium]|nr:thiamine diphosphokinase [Elusimicrobiota bacterium]